MLRPDRDSSVGIATAYGIDDPGIEFRQGRDFSHPSSPALGPTQPHLVVCLRTRPKPLPKRAPHIVRSRASSFRCEYVYI
jgi:hypothetical protein